MSRTPTEQQKSCIAAAVDSAIKMLKIEACAGAGKTSTLVLMANDLPVPSLYWCFNKANAVEAAEKFPEHVKCSTSHSTAYAEFGRAISHKLMRPKGKYVNVAGTGSEVARYYKISSIKQAGDVVLSDAFIGLLVKTAVARFEQSADAEIGIKHVPRGELFEKAKTTTFNMALAEQTVLTYARKLWNDRTNSASPVLATHDTYLKMFQLSKPVLEGFEVLYVDEFQDTTPCVMDIVMNQRDHMKVVVVGDSRQAIYAWRGAVNALKELDCETRMLTKSFRYGQAVADVATAVLEGALKIEGFEKINSVTGGVGAVDRSKPHTRLFRTNAALLVAAIEELRNGVEISIEIDVKDFVKLLSSAQALHYGEMKSVKHDKLLAFNNWKEMLEEAKHDAELGRISKIIQGGDASAWIDILEGHKNSKEPMVSFTTAHKSKGREFSQVIVEGDFKSNRNKDGEWVGLTEEEQNLLYVACTRAIDVLEYNSTVEEYLEYSEQEWDYVIEREVGSMERAIAA